MTGIDLLTGNSAWVASSAGRAFQEMLDFSPGEAAKLEVTVDDPELWDRELEFVAITYEGVIQRRINPRDASSWDPSCLTNQFLALMLWPTLMVYYHRMAAEEWLKLLAENDR